VYGHAYDQRVTVVSCVQTQRKLIALTFDDGPGPDTGDLLDVLDQGSAPATFFVRGAAIDASTEELLLRAAAAGHELANHTHSHLGRLGEREPAVVDEEILLTHRRLAELTGAEPTLIRPPYGHCLEEIDRAAGRLGYRATVKWSIMPRDWEQPGTDVIAAHVLGEMHAGAIVVMHDGSTPSREVHSRRQTVDAVRTVISELRGRGFELVTVSQLLTAGEPRS